MHLALVVNSDWFFLSHRLPLAVAARARGWDVTVVTPDTGRAHEIEAHGIPHVDLPLTRSGTGLGEVRTLRFLRRLYRERQPDLVHHVTSKPVIYGSLASSGLPTAVVNAVSGLGYAFIQKRAGHPLRWTLERLYRLALRGRHRWTIFQNDDDAALFAELGLADPGRSVLIRGSGVDLTAFAPSDEPPGLPVVLLPARLLWDKGVGEFVEAADRLRQRGVRARFALVGPLDAGNPAAVTEAEVRAWTDASTVEWWGYRTDMTEVYRQATIVVLPSYREGLSKALLEAGAMTRALVTTDAPGCRDVVTDGETGLLVPTRDAAALADAIGRLLGDSGLRQRFRHAARADIQARFSIKHIVDAHFGLYHRALEEARV